MIELQTRQAEKMHKNDNAQKRQPTRFDIHSLRNLSSPEDIASDRKIYAGQAPLTSILGLSTNENVRNYLADASGKVRKTYTNVHRDIRDTLLNNSSDFTVLNSGIVIVARDIQVEEKEKFVNLFEPSIINGAQTQGVIKDLNNRKELPDNTHIKFEIIIVNNDELIAEISIARNNQNDVLAVSIAGKRGYFNDLEKAVQKDYPQKSLRKSESEYSNEDDIIDTEKLLQVITSLIPQELWKRSGEAEAPNKVYTFSMKARCLKEFEEIFNKNNTDKDYADLYKFYLDIAPQAWALYKKWKSHQGFAGTRLRSLSREGKEIIEVPDGIIFPIISSLSVFAEKEKGNWTLNIPSAKIDKILIETAKRSYMEIADSNPQTMGKNKACYSSLLQISSLFKSLS